MGQQIRLLSAVAVLFSSPLYAALVMQGVDGPTPVVFANGGGGGFGGTLGNGSISMDVIGTNLQIVFTGGNSLNDVVALYLDTRSGGFLDADMSDNADGGRGALSNLTLTKNDTFPTQVLPDFGLAIGSFGSVLFELNAGNTSGHLQFQLFNAAPNITIPLALLGNPTHIDFFAGYSSGGGYNSNESLPYTTNGINQSGNPGFGDGQFGGLNTGGTYDNFNRFYTVAAVPEASTVCIWGIIFVSGVVLRRRFNNIAESGHRAA